ncbi:hypothetical protein [Paenibacillus agricola]|uniref:Uncharacterized protein n=1 Tax=Paenibacillus agricola TaxID=2716264 RepID=A0ABX0JMF6_9BACL|nr:hypothetical protein [Paenibacillus agricola]NHN35651.1 hypothetical protein [Paenibacillus agricola]
MDGTKTTKYKDGQIWLNGISLLNVQKWEEPNRSFREAHKRNETFTYAEDVFEIGPDTIVVQFLLPTSSTLNPITGVQGDHPAVLIQGGKVTLLQGLNRPFYDSQNSEKGKWLWTFSATRVSARSFNDVGQIYWVDKDGTTRNFNTILNATYLRVLYAREDRLLVQAYDLFRQNSEGKQSGYLWLHSNGTYGKVTELTPSRDPINSPTASGDNLLSAFVDSKLGVLVVQNNTITNLSTGQSRVWWDYELRALVKDDPIGGYPGQ